MSSKSKFSLCDWSLAMFWSLVLGHWSFAQVPPPPTTSNEILKRMTVDQKLNNRIPLDLVFRDEAGKEVQLKKYLGQKPAVLALVNYRCRSRCTRTLNGMSAAFNRL